MGPPSEPGAPRSDTQRDPPRVIFSEDAQERYQGLRSGRSKAAKMLSAAIDRTVTALPTNVHLGDPVAKRLFPKKYLRLEVSNLFRIPLPQFWRLLYTITTADGTTALFVLDILNHKEYDRLFGYRRR